MTDHSELIADWREAMEGVSAGPWRHYRNKLRPQFGGIINEVQCRSKTPVVAWPGFEDGKRKEPKHALNAAWIARCSPAGIATLLDALSSQSLSLSEAREEIERLRGALKPLADRIDEIEQVKAVAKFAAEGTAAVKLELLRNARSALENGPAGLADATNDPADLSSLRKGAEEPCPHAPTYDAGLCCGHPDDCTFVSPSALVSGSREDGA